MRARLRLAAAAALLLALTAPVGAQAAAPESREHWVASWAASPQESSVNAGTERTIRQVVRPSLGGTTERLHLTNRYGGPGTTIAGVTVALQDEGASVVPGSVRRVTFRGGFRSVTMPTGFELVSDPFRLPFRFGQHLVVSLYIKGQGDLVTAHELARQTTYLTPDGSGDHTRDTGAGAFTQTAQSWFFINGIDVLAPQSSHAVVAFGDSITDGYASTVDADRRWPDVLMNRLAGQGIAVINAGISGNQVTQDGAGVAAVKRFAQDALAQAGVTDVILLEGINDIHRGVPAATLIEGYRELVRQAHSRRLRIYGGTMTPSCCYPLAPFDFTPDKLAARETANAFIRTGKAFDGVIEFSEAIRLHPPVDGVAPEKIDQQYDCGDTLHPNDAGYAAMAQAVPLALLRR